MTGCSEHIFFKRRLFVELQDQDLGTVTNNACKIQKLPAKYVNCSIVKACNVPIVILYFFPSSSDNFIFVSAGRQLLNITLLLNLLQHHIYSQIWQELFHNSPPERYRVAIQLHTNLNKFCEQSICSCTLRC